jgi:hypothetical protein
VKHSQSGSVLIYILIAVVLFAALSFAMSQMMRSGSTLTGSEARSASATSVLQYADAVQNAVHDMQINGISDTSICFDAPGWGNNSYVDGACANTAAKVFDPAGGAVVWEAPAPGVNDTSPWLFTGVNGIAGIGTVCAQPSCADLKMMLPNVAKSVCIAIDQQLGLISGSAAPPVDTGYDAVPFTGAYTVSATADIGDEPGSAALSGQPEGCFQSSASPTAGTYHFYRVLISR